MSDPSRPEAQAIRDLAAALEVANRAVTGTLLAKMGSTEAAKATVTLKARCDETRVMLEQLASRIEGTAPQATARELQGPADTFADVRADGGARVSPSGPDSESFTTQAVQLSVAIASGMMTDPVAVAAALKHAQPTTPQVTPDALTEALTDDVLTDIEWGFSDSLDEMRYRIVGHLAPTFAALTEERDALRRRVQVLEAEEARLQAEAAQVSLHPAAACVDCGLAYDRFPLDVVLSDEQWLAIHPLNGGVLCGSCIVARGQRILNPIIAVLRFVGANEHEACSRWKNKWSFDAFDRVDDAWDKTSDEAVKLRAERDALQRRVAALEAQVRAASLPPPEV